MFQKAQAQWYHGAKWKSLKYFNILIISTVGHRVCFACFCFAGKWPGWLCGLLENLQGERVHISSWAKAQKQRENDLKHTCRSISKQFKRNPKEVAQFCQSPDLASLRFRALRRSWIKTVHEKGQEKNLMPFAVCYWLIASFQFQQ